jgi:hypothetical protein
MVDIFMTKESRYRTSNLKLRGEMDLSEIEQDPPGIFIWEVELRRPSARIGSRSLPASSSIARHDV